jgi:cellulose synthase/poly-beta-1,6-N-acetylglucosamine synthase-like glycosyltransferase
MLALVVLLLSLAALAYTFAGYPLLLLAWARLRARPVRKAAFEPEVAIVIVAHNGAEYVGRKIASCLAQDYPMDRMRVLLVSDGSNDATCALVEAVAHPRVSLLALTPRRGKAACVNDALAACPEEVVVMTDVRQPLERDAVRRLLENFADPDVGAASGTILHGAPGASGYGEGLDTYWRYEQFLRETESRVHSMVGVTGALYAMRRECFRGVPQATVLDDVYIPMSIVLQGRRVVLERRALAYDEPLASPARERARKVRTLAGNFQLLALMPQLLSPRNPVLLQFLSHKVMRLVGPVALAGALVANIALAGEGLAYALLLAAQLACYGCAIAGMVIPAARRVGLVKLSMTFVALNGYVVLGFIEFLTNRNLHLWSAPAQGDSRARP